MQIQKPADLARIVKTRRQSQGLTQQDIAEAVGITRQSLARIERGHAGASFDLVLRIFEKLGVRLEANSDGQRTVAVPVPTWDADAFRKATAAALASARKIDTSALAASAYKNLDVSAVAAAATAATRNIDTSALTAALTAATRSIDTSALTETAYKNLDVSAIAAAATAATRNIDTSALLSNWQSALKNLTERLRESTAKNGSEFSAEEARKALLSAAIEAGNPDRGDSTLTCERSSREALNGEGNG